MLVCKSLMTCMRADSRKTLPPIEEEIFSRTIYIIRLLKLAEPLMKRLQHLNLFDEMLNEFLSFSKMTLSNTSSTKQEPELSIIILLLHI